LGIDVLAKEMDAVLSSARCQATSENASIAENSSDSVAGRAGGLYELLVRVVINKLRTAHDGRGIELTRDCCK
jgi:hypothetical protein